MPSAKTSITIKDLAVELGLSQMKTKEALFSGKIGGYVESGNAREYKIYIARLEAYKAELKPLPKKHYESPEGTLQVYKHTKEDAEREARKFADDWVADPETMRLEKLPKKGRANDRTDQQIWDSKYKHKLSEFIRAKKVVRPAKKTELEKRELLEMPLGMNTFLLDKLEPEHAIYAFQRMVEYADELAENWNRPSIRRQAEMAVLEEVQIMRLQTMQILDPMGVDAKVDDSLTKASNRLDKWLVSLGLSKQIMTDQQDTEQDLFDQTPATMMEAEDVG